MDVNSIELAVFDTDISEKEQLQSSFWSILALRDKTTHEVRESLLLLGCLPGTVYCHKNAVDLLWPMETRLESHRGRVEFQNLTSGRNQLFGGVSTTRRRRSLCTAVVVVAHAEPALSLVALHPYNPLRMAETS